MNKNIEWLLRQNTKLKIYAIEIELNMPQGTLKKFVDGERDLPKHWHKSVSEWVKEFRRLNPE